MIITVGIGALIVLLIFMLQGAGNSSAGSASAQQPANTNGSASGSATPNWTQTTVVFDTITAPSVIPRVTIQEAKSLLDAGDAKIIDVRLKSLYDQGHIKGAVNVPQSEVITRVKDIPRTGTVILYCDCPHDEESAGTAYTLKTAGLTNIKILQGPQAYTEWKNAGYPVETSTP